MTPFDLDELERQAYRAGRGELVSVDMEKLLELTKIAKRFNEQTEEIRLLKAEIREQDAHIEALEKALGWDGDLEKIS